MRALDDTTFGMYSVEGFRLIFYEDARGRSQAREYLAAMKPKHGLKAQRLLALLGEKGPFLQRPYAAVLEGRVRELRPIADGHQHRFLFVIRERTILITNAFLKKSDAVPFSEIERAERCYLDWLRRQEDLDES